jgi:hypothetical protein
VKVTKPNTKETNAVTQENFIIELFCRVDDMLPKTGEHIQARAIFYLKNNPPIPSFFKITSGEHYY